jgi:DNA primase
VSSLAQIAGLLDAGGPISWRSAPFPPRVAVVRTMPSDLPALDRTPLQRILEVNDVAWRYLSSARLADQARAYLARRGIDVWQLERQIGAPLAGYTPADYHGLSAHLRRWGFQAEEILDAGWASRRDDGLVDRFHRRVLFPVRHPDGGIAGVIGRDVTDHARHKYLNTARTAAYCKGELLYQPLAGKPHDARVLVCEGPLDALAIASADAASTLHLFPVAPSGTALTPHQAQQIAGLSSEAPIVCADGDRAGVAASAKWQSTLRAAGARPTVVTMPDSHDPASYLKTYGTPELGRLIAHASECRQGVVGPGDGISA